MKTLFKIVLLLLILALASPLAGRELSPKNLQDAYAAIAEKAFPAVVVVGNYKFEHGGFFGFVFAVG